MDGSAIRAPAAQAQAEPAPASATQLETIAALLGCEVDAFLPGATGAHAQLSEFLQLWLQIRADEDRERLLHLARSLAAAN